MTAALVIGGAACVWDDVETALRIGSYGAVVACNDVGAAWPGRLDAWVSLHAEKMGRWAEIRRRNGFSPARRILGHVQPRPGRIPADVGETTEFRFPGQKESGSSGLFALKVALVDLGFDRAVLCGVPMAADGAHFFNPAIWNGARSHRRGWVEAMPEIKDRARSMSGWTADMLGAPTKDWLGA